MKNLLDGKRILHLDDEQGMVLLSTFLSTQGAETYFVHVKDDKQGGPTPSDVLQALYSGNTRQYLGVDIQSNGKPALDLLILDEAMVPEQYGHDIVEALCTQDAEGRYHLQPDSPVGNVIIYTSSCSDGALEDLARRGIPVLHKPMNVRLFIQKVYEIMNPQEQLDEPQQE